MAAVSERATRAPYREPGAPTPNSEAVQSAPPPTVVALCRVDVADVLTWVSAIPYERWPQQHRLPDGKLRPAMVNDPEWYGFGARVFVLQNRLAPYLRAGSEFYNEMLSVVMPGHSIPEHRDEQPAEWLARVHVPLATNPLASFASGGALHYLAVGTAYLVNTREPHAIRNDGETPRVHFMFDVRR